MARQSIHRRRFPIRRDGTRRVGTFSAGSKTPPPLVRKPRVFVSHHSKDEYAKRLLQAQSNNKNMDIQFSDQSVNKPFNEKWKTKTKKRIENSSTTIIMVGKDTHRRPAVQWEIEQSRKAGNKIIAVQIHKDKHHRLPQGIRKNEEMKWKIDQLSKRIRRR